MPHPRNLTIHEMPKHVLVVDDNLVVGSSMASVLQALGCPEVDEADGGYAAIEKARQKPYDLVLMDISMPDLDGFRAAKQVLALQPACRIVFLTGTELQDIKARLADFPDARCLRKPTKLVDLRRMLEQFKA